jgi:acyl carrier protein
MAGSANDVLKQELKTLIVTVCDKPVPIESVGDDAPLLGPQSVLGLDSLDVLQINAALQKRYGVRIRDGKQALGVMRSVNTLADFVSP